jgi:hypothetical protein
MPKKKLKKQSGEALLCEVRKEMAQPRAAASTRSEVLGLSRLLVPRVKKTFSAVLAPPRAAPR